MAATAPKVTGLDASYYYVKDIDRATKFYTELLGSEPSMTHPGVVTEWTFPSGETFGLYKPQEEQTFRTGGGIIFAVDDVHAAVKAHKARGVDVEEHVEETPVCFMGFGTDTEGNGFILHKRK
jgi:predicted enzyme related to lactoylglutathione lyase